MTPLPCHSSFFLVSRSLLILGSARSDGVLGIKLPGKPSDRPASPHSRGVSCLSGNLLPSISLCTGHPVPGRLGRTEHSEEGSLPGPAYLPSKVCRYTEISEHGAQPLHFCLKLGYRPSPLTATLSAQRGVRAGFGWDF